MARLGRIAGRVDPDELKAVKEFTRNELTWDQEAELRKKITHPGLPKQTIYQKGNVSVDLDPIETYDQGGGLTHFINVRYQGKPIGSIIEDRKDVGDIPRSQVKQFLVDEIGLGSEDVRDLYHGIKQTRRFINQPGREVFYATPGHGGMGSANNTTNDAIAQLLGGVTPNDFELAGEYGSIIDKRKYRSVVPAAFNETLDNLQYPQVYREVRGGKQIAPRRLPDPTPEEVDYVSSVIEPMGYKRPSRQHVATPQQAIAQKTLDDYIDMMPLRPGYEIPGVQYYGPTTRDYDAEYETAMANRMGRYGY